jgi:diaminohydroxyphosphoribosylaminopyrimidine deaminase/5-amino-6-(5-phosphoribosylamino)uracil reductase
MARAIALAWGGWGRVAPNPLVGAVVLSGGAVVGEGWHAEYGEAHAEPVALAAAGDRARGATLVVTLEPCAHVGKQPACTEAVLRAGIARVVAAIADPSPDASGGADRLRAAGVEVEVGLLGCEAAAQNAPFLHHLRDTSRPYVALKLATTLDGRIADATGQSRWISGPDGRDYVQWLRAGFDAIGVGGRTARRDDASLTVRGPLAPRVPPRRVIFDPALQLDPEQILVRTARDVPTVVVAAPGIGAGRRGPLEAAGVTVVDAADLRAALAALRGQGVRSLLVEGGGRLAGALLAAGLVDRFYWIQAPLWLGDGAVPAIAGLFGVPLERAARWRVVERRALGEDTLLVVDRRSCSPGS